MAQLQRIVLRGPKSEHGNPISGRNNIIAWTKEYARQANPSYTPLKLISSPLILDKLAVGQAV